MSSPPTTEVLRISNGWPDAICSSAVVLCDKSRPSNRTIDDTMDEPRLLLEIYAMEKLLACVVCVFYFVVASNKGGYTYL